MAPPGNGNESNDDRTIENNEYSEGIRPLLSRTLEINNNHIEPEIFSDLCAYATTLQLNKKAITQLEKNWLDDFLANLSIARLAEEEASKAAIARLKADLIANFNINSPRNSCNGENFGGAEEPHRLFDRHTGTSSKRNITFRPNVSDINGSDHEYLNDDPNFGDPVQKCSTFIKSRKSDINRTHESVVKSIGESQIVRMNEIVLMPKIFEGEKDKALSFIEEYEAAAGINSWSQATMIKYFPSYLCRTARDWYVSICIPRLSFISSWNEVKTQFLTYYIGPHLGRALREEFAKLRQGEESITQFVPRAYRLVKQVYPGQSEETNLLDLKDKLKPNIRRYLIGHRFKTIEDFHDACMEIEDSLGKLSQNRQSISDNKVVNETKPSRSSLVGNEELCKRCDRNHKTDNCRARFKKDGTPLQSSSALIDEDLIIEEEEEEPSDDTKGKVTTKEVTMRQYCAPILLKDAEKNVKVVATNLKAGRPDVPIHEVTLNGHKVKAMFDTGAHRSLIEEKLAKEMGLTTDQTSCTLLTAGSTPLKTLGTVLVELKLILGLVQKSAKIRLVVTESLVWPLIIGVDYLALFRINVSLGLPNRLSFRGERNGVVVCEPLVLPANSESLCEVILEKIDPPDEILIKPINFGPGVLIAYSISRVVDNKAQCLVCNPSRKPIIINAGTQIAGFEIFADEKQSFNSEFVSSNVEMKIGDTNEIVKVGSELNQEQVNELIKLINSNIRAFSINGELGETNVLEHDIELIEGAKPYVEPLRRRPQLHKDEIRKQVYEMLKQGVIEKSNSPWASAYVVVKKKTGDLRICIDFRRLNDQTKKTSYPLPNVEDCLEPLCGNKYFSTLDLASGFWQIPLSKRARELTAFRTEEGLYQFCRMPFGLCNAPASFQRLVNGIFAGLTGLHLQIFIDDLCVATPSWEDHLTMLGDIFSLLIKSNLKLKSSKCIFGSSSVTFLGHMIDKSGIRADPEKVKAIAKLPRPKSVDEIRRVHGLLNYYRRLIPKFAELAEPFTKLMRKNASFVWSDEQERGFNQIKEILCSEPVLAHFKQGFPIALKTDASKIGLAGILMQRLGEEWRIISCCSRNTNSCEKNYSISDLEGLAIVYSVDKFRNYLLGTHFSILTDHCPLCVLKIKMAKSPRLRRWAILLSEFNFSVIYTKGSEHQDVDCLSRAPVDDGVDDHLDDKILTNIEYKLKIAMIVPIDHKKWKEMSEKEDEAKEHYVRARERKKGYRLLNGLLYYEERLFVPKLLRMEVMSEGHDITPAGHGGVRATLNKLRNYWWPGMAQDIKTYVDSCENCQKNKSLRQLPPGEMFSFETTAPLELIAIDILGPLPPTKSNNKHVIVALECFSRFVDLQAVVDIQGKTIADFVKGYIGRYGIPLTILTDNAASFSNENVRNVLDVFKIKHRLSTARHHQGNAMVERAIQSVQQKLVSLTHDPAHSIEWDNELHNVMLSINTAYHNSTGFSPYEILFCMEPNEISDVVKYHENQNRLLSFRQREASRIRIRTNENQIQARENSRIYFDRIHRSVVYKVGDFVLTQVGEGRRSKLQSNYQGPYVVLEKNNDIYKIKRVEGRPEILFRHTSNLRPYFIRVSEPNRVDTEEIEESQIFTPEELNNPIQSVSSVVVLPKYYKMDKTIFKHSNPHDSMRRTILVLAMLFFGFLSLELTYAIKFKQASPVLWLESRVAVSPAPTSFVLQMRWAAPCNRLYSFQGIQPEILRNAVFQCEAVFNQQIVKRLEALVIMNTQMINVKQNFVPPLIIEPPLQHLNNKVTIENRESNSKIRIKRQMFALGYIVGSFISNVWEVVKHKIWHENATSELTTEIHAADIHLEALTHEANITDRQLQAMHDYTLIQGKLLENHIHRTEAFFSEIPSLAILISDIIARLHLIGVTIDRIHTTSRNKRLDLDAIISLFDTDIIDNVDPLNVDPNSVKFLVIDKTTIQVRFVGRQHSIDTHVYKTSTFNLWMDLLDNPTLYQYKGPTDLVYNETSHCVKGISEAITNNFVQAQCPIKNYEDNRLSHWEPILHGDPNTNLIETQVKTSFPYTFIYCYGREIEIKREKNQCPPFVFQLNSSLSWSTDDYNYDPQVIGGDSQTVDPVIVDVHSIHFKNTSHLVDLTEALSVLRKRRIEYGTQINSSVLEKEEIKKEYQKQLKVLREESRIYLSENSFVSFKQLIAGICVCLVILITMRIIYYIRTLRKIKKIQAQNAIMQRSRAAREASREAARRYSVDGPSPSRPITYPMAITYS